MTSEIQEHDHRSQWSIIFHKGKNSSCESGKPSFKSKEEDMWNWEIVGKKQVSKFWKMCKNNARWTKTEEEETTTINITAFPTNNSGYCQLTATPFLFLRMTQTVALLPRGRKGVTPGKRDTLGSSHTYI